MSLKRIYIIFLFFVISCQLPDSSELRLGKWRGVFLLQGKTAPFNFSVEDDTAGTVKVFLTNADERFILDSLRYERDSVIIPVEVYDALLVAKVNGDSLSGFFRKNQLHNRGLAFKASRNQELRFESKNTRPVSNAKGTWSVTLTDQKEVRYSVGKFKQIAEKVTGTILTTTGDYRYFDGIVDGDSLKISAFSGSNPSLLLAKFSDSLHLTGDFFSPRGKVKFEAIKNDTAKLPDPYSLTYLKNESEPFNFTFPDLEGKAVSLSDEKFKGKVVIVTLLGSWCPNCLDEAAFLSPWYKENKNRGIEIIGLSFERKDDLSFAKARLEKFIKRFDIQYDILFAGLSDKAEASRKLPSLNAVRAFPTTIIVDPSGKVSTVHTGFSGPATGELYSEFIQEFNAEVNRVLPKPSI